MKVTRLACGLMLVVPVLMAEAEVYRYVDKNGNQVFTDSPPQGAEKVPQGPVMTMPFPKPRAKRSSEAEEVKAPVAKKAAQRKAQAEHSRLLNRLLLAFEAGNRNAM